MYLVESHDLEEPIGAAALSNDGEPPTGFAEVEMRSDEDTDRRRIEERHLAPVDSDVPDPGLVEFIQRRT
jgi:hypothetical protein